MARKYPLIPQVKIERVGAKGMSIAHDSNGKTIIVQGAVPGDVVDVQVFKKRKNYLQGKAVAFHSYSENRTNPVCKHFGVCGGCKWQNLEYSAQLFWKDQEVKNNLKRIGQIEPETYLPILASENTYEYRNKMEFSFSDRAWLTPEEIQSGETFENRNALGFHIPGQWSKILHLEECHLQAQPSSAIREGLYNFANANDLSFWNPYEQKGFLRSLMIKTTSLKQIMLVLQVAENDTDAIEKTMDYLASNFDIQSLYYSVNQKGNDSIYDLDLVLHSGEEFVLERMGDLKFMIGPKSFYQTNSEQAARLYSIVDKFANFKGDEIVYDLYSGLGTISQFVAHKVKKLVGVESVNEAVEAAYANAELNEITNCEFVAGDMKNIFNEEFIEKYGKADVVITDPPRDGMHPKVVEQLLGLNPEKIVYVSCNSATQARDLALMKEQYTVKISQAVDMFPQTHHVENVVLLERKADS